MDVTEQGVNVKIGTDGVLSLIMLNGIDFSKAVSAITYHHEAGNLPTLELSIANIDELEIQAVVGSVLLKGGVAAPKFDTTTSEN